MNPIALQYHYAVQAGDGSGGFTDWLRGKRVQRIAITCGSGVTAELHIFLQDSPPTTPYIIEIGANEKLVLLPEGTATGDFVVQQTGGPTADLKWVVEAWQPA